MKKYLFTFLSLLCIFCLTGCDVDEFGTAFENFLKNNNSAVRSTEINSVEGHIKNIEYALMQIELKGTGIDFNNQYSRDELNNLLSKYKISIPANDTIKCETYKIKKVKVEEATGCTDLGQTGEKNQWNDRKYTFRQGEHAKLQ